MDVLGVIWWGSAAGALVAVAVAVTTPSRRREALVTAGLLFLVAGVLGILSIGIVFIVAAIVCGFVAARAATTDGGGPARAGD